MSLSVIDKYVAKKEKDLLEYAKILESLITTENNNMWSSKKEFSGFAKEIIEIYASKYYFQNNKHKDNPIEYSNDNINFVLKSIIEYFKNNEKIGMIKKWKNETFLLSVILCTACYVDFATNVVDGDFQDTKSKFKYLLNYLSKTKVLIIKDNKYFINDLFDAIKKNMNEDNKVVNAFISDNYQNNYKLISNHPVYYEISFTYDIPELKEYDDKLVNKVKKEYNAKFKEVMMEIYSFHLLKELISNKEIKVHLIKIDKVFKRSVFNKYLDNEYIKKYTKVLVSLKEESEYQNIISEYKNLGIGVVYEINSDEEISTDTLINDIELLVSSEFVKNNEVNKLAFDKKNIKLVVKNKEE